MILKTPVDLSSLLENNNSIGERDVRHFRQEVFRDGVVSLSEADSIFMINDNASKHCEEWHIFFVEALSDFLVHQAEPRGFVSRENAEWLVRQVQHDGKICSATELELLVKTIEKASDCPPNLVSFVLSEIARMVIDGEGELQRGRQLTKGVIGESEAELVRRVLYGVSSDGGIAISRAEAEILFKLNDETLEEQNHPAWNDLFVKAVANHLMAISGYTMPDRKQALAREEWLDDTQVDVGGMLAQSLSSIGSMFSGGISDMFKSDHERVEEAWAERNARVESQSLAAESIDAGEAKWLVERIGHDGVFHENEQALIRFIKQESMDVHPDLKPLLDKVA